MSDPDHTAARLVAAAERLFAGGGEEATSLRAITREARSNAAAVHYHFGGRDELLRAVLAQHLAPLAQRRTRLLDLAKAELGEPVGVEALIEAAVRPELELLAELRRDKVQVARFLGRAYTLPGAAVAEFVERQFWVLEQQILPMLRDSLPEVSESELRQRLRLVLATVVFVFATAQDTDGVGPLGSDDVDEQVRRLVAFGVGGTSAGTSEGISAAVSGRAGSVGPKDKVPPTAPGRNAAPSEGGGESSGARVVGPGGVAAAAGTEAPNKPAGRKAASSKVAPGQAASGKAASGKAASGKAASGKAASGQAASGPGGVGPGGVGPGGVG